MTGLRTSRTPSWDLVRGILLLGLLLAVSGFGTASATTSTTGTSAAGLVVKHGDGTVLYYLVRFNETELAATDLLQRAGLAIDVAPYAGLGQAVCRIGGEGCPSTNCFCKSYANPSFYWRYEKLEPDGKWTALPYAASKKAIHDGDVVGFSWSSQDGDLPAVTLQQIASMNGVTLAPTRAAVVATPSATNAVATSTAAAEVTTTAPPAPATTATSAAVGVEVKPSGTVTTVDTHRSSTGSGAKSYAWFGAGVAVIALLGVVVVARRRRG